MLPTIIKNSQPSLYEARDIKDYLVKPEVDLLLEKAIDNPRDWLLILCGWTLGLRISELIKIKKGDIDYYNQSIKVVWLKKRKAMNRHLPLPDITYRSLNQYIASLNKDDLIFPISRIRAFQIIKKYEKLSGISKNISPHTLRHSFAIHFLKQTRNLAALQKWLGHSQITTTMIYLRIVQSDLADEIKKVEF